VLKGLDLERYRPRHILVEQSDSGEPRDYLLANGYREVAELSRGRLTHDVLYEATTTGGWTRVLARLRRR
jgi:hypothetical protein